MPDKRRHRGAAPGDPERFGARALPTLKTATADLAWLLGRGYRDTASLKLVGDRFQLDRRQRQAIGRAAVPAERAAARRAKEADAPTDLVIDGFNLIISVEAALSGAPILRCGDGLWRDLASVHGTWRRVEETERALDVLVGVVGTARWLLDRPVSNSGRLAGMLRDRGQAVELLDAVDAELKRCACVASSDGIVIDGAATWFDAKGRALAGLDFWAVELA
jgi:hypothetical protein